MASKFIIDDALISDMLNFSAKPSPSYRQAEDESMRGLESLLIPEPYQSKSKEELLQDLVRQEFLTPTQEKQPTFLDQLPFFTDFSKIDLTKEPGDRGRFDITEKAIEEVGNSFKGIIDMHSEGMKQLDKDFADDPVAKNALKTLGYISTGFNTAVTAGFSPFMLGTAYVGDIVANITGDETQGKQIFRDLNTFLIGKGGEAAMSFKVPSKKGVVEATVNKDGSINVGGKTYGGDLNLTRAQFMELVRRETFGSAGRETGNLNLAPLREDGLPSPTVSRTEIPKVETKEVTQAKINKTTNELSNIKPTQSILDLEDYQYGNVGTRGFTEEAAGEIYSAEGYEQYQKEVQDIVRKNLGNNFTVYRGTTTKELDMEAGEPITRAGVSVTFNPKEAEAFVSGQLSLPAKEGEPVLLKINASPEMIVMRGSDTGELVLDGYSLNKSNIEIIPISKKQNNFLVKPASKDIPNNTPISVKPIPKKVAVDKGMSENEGVYMANIEGKNVDLKDKTFNTGTVSVTPEGIPQFTVQDPINRDIEKVKGAKLTKVNLFKKEAGWNWVKRPEGANDKFLVSIEQGGKHYYALKVPISADVQLKYFPNQKSEPRLRPTVYDDIILGEPVGEIDVRGVKHPVYNTVELTPPKQALGADVTSKDKGKVLQFEKKEEPPRDESSGMAADYVPPQYGPPAFDLTQVVKEEFSPEGFSTFSTDVGSNYQRLDDFIYVRPSNDPIQSAIYREQLSFIDSLKKIKGNPNAKVVMYRAAPTKELREGDLLTPSKTEAKFYVDESKITREDIRKAERDRRLSEDVVDLQKEKNIKTMENIQDIFGEQKVTPSQLFRYELDAKDVRWDGGNRGILGWGYFPSKEKTIYHPLNEKFKKEIREVLSTDLLSPQYLAKLEKNADISCGQCYAAAEALYHKWAKFKGFTPKYLTSKDFPEGLDKGDTHWFLQNNKTKEILDPTAEQFGNTPIPYEKGTGAGFLTKEPGKNKGKEVLNRLGTEKVIQTPSGMIIDFANQKGVEMEGAPLKDWIEQHKYDIEYNYPERKSLGNLKNTTGNDPRFTVGFETKDGNRGYLLGYGTDKNIGFIDWITNLGTKDMPKGAEPPALKPSELKELKNELQKHYGFRQFAGDRITGVRKENRNEQGQTYPPKDLFAITPKPKSGVDLMLNPTLASFGRTEKISLRDVFDYLDDVPKRSLYNPVERKQMLKEAFDEIVFMKQQAVSGEGWYRNDVNKAMKVVEKILPVVKERPILKDFLLFLTGISSALTPVGNDFRIAIQMVKHFTDKSGGKNREVLALRNPYENYGPKDKAVKEGLAQIGEPKKWNRNAENLEKQLTFVQNYIDEYGLEKFMKFLFKKIKRRDLAVLRKNFANMGPLAGKLDEEIFGFENFGPKVGPFLANISGVTNLNVIDLWNSRGMNRRTGDMFIRDKNGKILSYADTPRNKTERELWNGFMDELAQMANLSVDDTQAILWYFEQLLYTHLGVKSEPKSYADIAKEFLEAAEEASNDSNGGVRKSDDSKNRNDVPKKAQGGSISIPQRRSLVNDGLVDINYIIGR